MLRRGPRIVLLPAHPDAFLNLSPQRAMGPVLPAFRPSALPSAFRPPTCPTSRPSTCFQPFSLPPMLRLPVTPRLTRASEPYRFPSEECPRSLALTHKPSRPKSVRMSRSVPLRSLWSLAPRSLPFVRFRWNYCCSRKSLRQGKIDLHPNFHGDNSLKLRWKFLWITQITFVLELDQRG